MVNDTKEQIEYCLNCKLPPGACNSCNGLRHRRRKIIPDWKEKKMNRMFADGATDREISERLSICKSTVWNRRKEWEYGGRR